MSFSEEELYFIYNAVALATQMYTTDMSDMDNAYAWADMGDKLQDKLWPAVKDIEM